MLSIAGGIGWLHLRIAVGEYNSIVTKKHNTHRRGLAWFLKRIFHLMMGMMLVVEGDKYNLKLQRAIESNASPEVVSDLKANRNNTALTQFVKDHEAKKAAMKKALLAGKTPKQIEAETANIKAPQDGKVGDAKHRLSDQRRAALQALALFLTYGTAGLFSVWLDCRGQVMPDSVMLINLTSILNSRRKSDPTAKPHVYGARAWNRLDNHIFKILKDFLNNKGRFDENLSFDEMTEKFSNEINSSTIADLFVLDLQSEIFTPGYSRKPDGSVAPEVDIKKDAPVDALAPCTQEFREIWAITEGPLQPVSKKGEGMYPERAGGRVHRQETALTQMSKDQAKVAAELEQEGDSGEEDEDADRYIFAGLLSDEENEKED
jgi:hypothetical protein